MNLRTRLLLYSIILALIPLGTAGMNMIQITEDELKSGANENLLNVANQISQEVDDFYQYTWLTPLKLVKKAVENKKVDIAAKLSLLESGMQNVGDIVAMQIDVVGLANPLFVQKSEYSAKLAEKGLDPKETLLIPQKRLASFLEEQAAGRGDIRYVEKADAWMMSIHLPMKISGRASLLSATINLENLKERILSNPFNKSGKITVVGPDERELFNPERPVVEKNSLVNTAMEQLAANNKTVGVKPYTALGGDEMLGGYSYPQNMDMAVLVSMDKDNAYLAVSQMKKNLIFWVLGGLAVAVVGAVVVTVSLTRPLHTLMGVASRISGGDLSVEIPLPKRNDEITQLSRAFNKMAVDLQEHINILTETTKAKERAESELKLAHQIQQTFLPKDFPSSDRVDIGGMCIPARDVGGDYYDFFQLDDENYGLVIGDVSGKGIPAALFMAVSRTLFRILSSRISDPGEVMTEFNDRLVELDQGSNMFITLFYGVFNANTHKLVYSNAGHNMPYMSKPRSKVEEFAMLPQMKTMVSGIMDGLTFHSAETFMRRSGDAIIMYTDGMTEAINTEEEEFGEDRLETLLKKNFDLPAQELCAKTIREVQDFQVGMPQFDDMTMLVLKVK